MNQSVTTASLITIVATIITTLATCTSTGQPDEPILGAVAPSPTWLFSSASAAITPTLTQVADANRKAASHPTPTPHPKMLKRGQYLFYSVGCFYCHGIKAEGGIGPQIARTDLPLDLVIHQVYYPDDEMPAFYPSIVSESDLAAIYAYLQSLKPTGSRPQITTDHPDAVTGEALYHFFGCFGCHGYHGEGGFGQQLAGTTLSFEEVRLQVRTPRERMPPFGPEWISNEELAHIYAFLQSMTSYSETN